ncbi:hypothetical protein [Paenibacillus paeoniae]|uniref:hypothetical protein n=1 Tax=Paenibacillus paeoniae TaxID=2292705 RepID=UPI001F0C060F|nr:hypothetical protein [Paenibacillus paeoniae]
MRNTRLLDDIRNLGSMIAMLGKAFDSYGKQLLPAYITLRYRLTGRNENQPLPIDWSVS